MGIQVEFNPDLALRDISNFENGTKKEEECIPKNLNAGETYSFLKKGQRNYWLEGEIPLLKTEGNQQLSKPIASIIIIKSTHFVSDGELWTKGLYKVIDVFDVNDNKINFESYKRKK